MPGSITFSPPPIPYSRSGEIFIVSRYTPNSPTPFTQLPNVRYLGRQFREGAEPPSARLRYAFFDPYGQPSDPERVEEVFPFDAAGPLVVEADDRLCVHRVLPNGSLKITFDGYAQIPQADLSKDVESATFTLLGTPVREWDTPLGGATMRDADAPTTVSDIDTDMPPRFNPEGKWNCTPLNADSGDVAGHNGYPVFIGPGDYVPATSSTDPSYKLNGTTLRPWTVDLAACYIIAKGNEDQKYTTYLPVEILTDVLFAIEPTAVNGQIDVSDPSSYTYEPIPVQDYDIRGEPWPVALERLISPHGFGMRWVLTGDSKGIPKWSLDIYRKDDNQKVKSLNMPAVGATYDPAQINAHAITLARDSKDLANQIVVDTDRTWKEASFVLGCGFHISASDASNLSNFIEGNPSWSGANLDKYRLFILDELGEGHWDFNSTAFVSGTTKAANLDQLFGGNFFLGIAKRPYVRRRRPGKATLFTLDAQNKPRKAELWVIAAANYAGPVPGIWDGTGGSNWRKVNSDEWHLLPDRLGIRLTCADPNNFKIGSSDPEVQGFSAALSVVERHATPSANAPLLYFRVTCIVEDDQDLGVSAQKRQASPTRYTVERRTDATHRFKKHVVSRYSQFSATPGAFGNDVATVDDTSEAQDFADGARRARELPVIAGTVTIPRFTEAYEVGDKIDMISGRNISLRSNAATQAGESPIYPTVVAVLDNNDGGQSVTLELSDFRAEPPPKTREHRESDE